MARRRRRRAAGPPVFSGALTRPRDARVLGEAPRISEARAVLLASPKPSCLLLSSAAEQAAKTTWEATKAANGRYSVATGTVPKTEHRQPSAGSPAREQPQAAPTLGARRP